MASDENIVEKLLRHTEMGNIDQMIDLIENFEISGSIIDKVIRKCLKNVNTTKKDNVYNKMFTYLINKCNINFQSKDDNNSTILMVICSKGDGKLLDELLKLKNLNIKLSDDHNNNALQYVINYLTEDTAERLIERLIPLNQKYFSNPSILSSLIECAEKRGYMKITSKLSEIETINSINLFDTTNYKEAVDKVIIKFDEDFFKKEWNSIVRSYYAGKFKDEFENISEEGLFNLSIFFDFFQKCTTDFSHERLNYHYNYIVFLFKLGKLPQLISNFKEIIQYVNKDNFYLFFNLSLVILEVSLYYRESYLFDLVYELLSKKLEKVECNINMKKYYSYFEKINFINIFNKKDKNTEAIKILSFMRFYYLITFNKLDRKIMNTYLKYIEDNYNELYYFLKIRLYYLYKETDKCKEKLSMLIDFYKDSETLLYYNNTNGILSLQNKNYSLAEFYFKQSLKVYNKIKKNDIFNTNFTYSKILNYNLGLTYFFQKKYDKVVATLKPILSELWFLPFIYYRLGLSLVELYLEEKRKQNNFKQNSVYERVIHLPKSDLKYTVLNSSTVNTVKNNDAMEKIKEALYYFTQLAISLESEKSCYFTDVNEVLLKEIKEDTTSQFKEENLSQNFKSMDELKRNALLNIIFCLILLKNWNQIFIYFEKLDKLNLDTEGKIKFLFYKLEVFIQLNKQEECLIVIDSIMSIEKVNNYMLFDNSFLNSLDSSLYTSTKYKMAFYINIVKFYLNQGKFELAEKSLSNIISMIKYNEYPPYVLNIFIYYYITKERYDIALKIVKNRKLTNI